MKTINTKENQITLHTKDTIIEEDIVVNFEGSSGEVVYKGEPYTEECERIADEITSRNSGICFYYEPYNDEEVS